MNWCDPAFRNQGDQAPKKVRAGERKSTLGTQVGIRRTRSTVR